MLWLETGVHPIVDGRRWFDGDGNTGSAKYDRHLVCAAHEFFAVSRTHRQIAIYAIREHVPLQHEVAFGGRLCLGVDSAGDATGDGRARNGIDEQKRSGLRRLREYVDGRRTPERNLGDGDVVCCAAARRVRGHRFEIEQRLDFDVRDRNEIGRRAQQIAGRRAERILRKPDETRFDRLRCNWPHLGRREYGAARHVDIDIELQRNRLSGRGAFEIAAHCRDAYDLTGGAAQSVRHHVAYLDGARGDRAREPAKILPVTQHRLHRQAEHRSSFAGSARHLFKMLDERLASVPSHVLRERRNIVAVNRRKRNCRRVPEVEFPAKRAEVRLDLAEHVFRPADEIHLVDREHDVLDADEIEDRRVSLRLLFDAGARVDEHDRNVGVRSAGRHVARVLLVAW